MKRTIEIDVTDCRDCLFKRSIRGHGECWEQCGHKEHGQGDYGNILWGCQAEFSSVPKWCPIGAGS